MRRGNAATNGTRFSSVGQDDSVSSSKLHPHHAATKKGGGIDGHVSPKSIAAPASCTTSVYVSFSKNSFLLRPGIFFPKAGAKVRTIFCSHKLLGIFFAKRRNIFASFDKCQDGRGETLYKLLRRRDGRRTAASLEGGRLALLRRRNGRRTAASLGSRHMVWGRKVAPQQKKSTPFENLERSKF